MKANTSNKYLITAILIGVAFHTTALFFTLEYTYDALIHLFFAEHYANSWFEPWNYKWYTGFTVTSYPPLVHQTIAALSFIGGLKFGLFLVAILCVVLFITGVYRFSLLITANRTVAGYAAILGALSSSFAETLHIFGQLPSIVGISVLLHALPEIYLWLKTGKLRYLCNALSLMAVTVTSHHVTPIFGMVFFIFPLIGMAIMDASKTTVGSTKGITLKVFIKHTIGLFKRITVFGLLSLIVIIGCILPYWINSKKNPITQVPIPHGSRDNFLEITSSGLVFFLIPWGILLIVLPYIFYRFYSKRYLFFGFSISLLTILGTGGTTPIPKLFLGESAFNILTLDRFTLWASIMALPIFGEFVYRLVEADLKTFIKQRFGSIYHKVTLGALALIFTFMLVFTMSLGYFRPSQPQKLNMLPIVNFLNQDMHYRWRYMTLGFGDQMAWLSAQTNALSVDGNYHSARRLPELTTRPIERLENSKFKGIAGIGSLQQFLTVPEKYNLKYIFSNDKFYDPILFFCGWQRLRQLENGIQVWEKLNVPPLPSILPKDELPKWVKLMWGFMPFLTVLIAFFLNIHLLIARSLKINLRLKPMYLNFKPHYTQLPKILLLVIHAWAYALVGIVGVALYGFYIKNDSHHSPKHTILAYYDALDFKAFEKAHKLINPKQNINLAQYMLNISVTDGLLSSYAKLDAIETKLISENDTLVTAMVKTKWITPLENISEIHYKTLVKIDNKWFIQANAMDLDLPPDQFYTNNQTQYFNQGRRRITTEETHHEDVLKQPALELLSAKLVKHDNAYSIIGEIQNIDNIPADIVLKGTLYDENNTELATYNAKYHVKHKLMPKETSMFKIDFEGIAWTKLQDSIPKTFNPHEFTVIDFPVQPTKFNLQAAGNVTSNSLYKQTALSNITINKHNITGTLFNAGVNEITVPQLLIGYYDSAKELIWVDHAFLKDGIRQQRKLNFEYSTKSITTTIITEAMDNCFVNGLPNGEFSKKMVNPKIKNKSQIQLQPTNGEGYSYIKFETNAYIGNPK